MANFIVSYDLNGPRPTHAEMDRHMETAGWARGRILETVWYVGTNDHLADVYNHVNDILSKDDQLLVVEAKEIAFRDLLIGDESLSDAWNANR